MRFFKRHKTKLKDFMQDDLQKLKRNNEVKFVGQVVYYRKNKPAKRKLSTAPVGKNIHKATPKASKKHVPWYTKVLRWVTLSGLIVTSILSFVAPEVTKAREEENKASVLVNLSADEGDQIPVAPVGKEADLEVVLNTNESIIDSISIYPSEKYTGKASYYSKDGCLGCDENQIMANGEVFNELDYTLAMNHLPLNSIVRVTNLENGLKAVARVTDTGCFNQKGRDMNAKNGVICTNNLDRIADLSKRLADEIGLKTDVSTIEIQALPNE